MKEVWKRSDWKNLEEASYTLPIKKSTIRLLDGLKADCHALVAAETPFSDRTV